MVAIFVLLTILLFVAVEVVRSHLRAPAVVPEPAPGAANLGLGWKAALPSGLFLHPGHTWAELASTGAVRVGLDDLASRALGTPSRVSLRQVGEKVAQGDPIVTLECNGRELSLPAPVSGVIEQANQSVLADPSALAGAPYDRGWLYEMRASKLGSEITSLAVAEVAWAWLQDQVHDFGDWLANLGTGQVGMAMQDGGQPASGALAHVDDAAFAAFGERFIRGSQVAASGRRSRNAGPVWATGTETE